MRPDHVTPNASCSNSGGRRASPLPRQAPAAQRSHKRARPADVKPGHTHFHQEIPILPNPRTISFAGIFKQSPLFPQPITAPTPPPAPHRRATFSSDGNLPQPRRRQPGQRPQAPLQPPPLRHLPHRPRPTLHAPHRLDQAIHTPGEGVEVTRRQNHPHRHRGLSPPPEAPRTNPISNPTPLRNSRKTRLLPSPPSRKTTPQTNPTARHRLHLQHAFLCVFAPLRVKNLPSHSPSRPLRRPPAPRP
jgi:hypothetical protein